MCYINLVLLVDKVAENCSKRNSSCLGYCKMKVSKFVFNDLSDGTVVAYDRELYFVLYDFISYGLNDFEGPVHNPWR